LIQINQIIEEREGGSVAGFCSKIGVPSVNNYYNWVRRDGAPSLQILRKIRSIYNVDIDVLAGEDDPSEDGEDKQKEDSVEIDSGAQRGVADKHIGKRIRCIVDEMYDKDIGAFARNMGVTVKTVEGWIDEKSRPNESQLKKMCRVAYGVDREWLDGYSVPMFQRRAIADQGRAEESALHGNASDGEAMIGTMRLEEVSDLCALIRQKIAERRLSEKFVMEELGLSVSYWSLLMSGRDIPGSSNLAKLHRVLSYLDIDTKSYSECTGSRLLVSIGNFGRTPLTEEILPEISQHEKDRGHVSAYTVIEQPLPHAYTSDAYKHWAWLPIRNKTKGGKISMAQLMQDVGVDERFLDMLCFGVIIDLNKYQDVIKRLGLSIDDFDKTQSRLIIVIADGSEKIMEASEFFALLDSRQAWQQGEQECAGDQTAPSVDTLSRIESKIDGLIQGVVPDIAGIKARVDRLEKANGIPVALEKPDIGQQGRSAS